jgi:hypothetical protein
LLLLSRNRVTAIVGGWLAVIAGAWFVVGRAAAGPLGLGNVGGPVASTDSRRLWLELSYFHGLGAVIVLLGAFALGRLSVRTLRDVEYARRPVASVATTDTTTAPVAEPAAERRRVETTEPTAVPERAETAEPAAVPERAEPVEPAAAPAEEQRPRRFSGIFGRRTHAHQR